MAKAAIVIAAYVKGWLVRKEYRKCFRYCLFMCLLIFGGYLFFFSLSSPLP